MQVGPHPFGARKDQELKFVIWNSEAGETKSQMNCQNSTEGPPAQRLEPTQTPSSPTNPRSSDLHDHFKVHPVRPEER